jgi:uncharacterized protein (DUF4213/DUF364 family)
MDRRPPGLRKLGPPETQLLQRLLAAAEFMGEPLDQMALGSRFVAIRSQERMGLSSTLGASPDPEDLETADKLSGAPLGDAAQLIYSPKPWLASLGLAALNAAYLPTCSADPGNLEDLLPGLCAGRRVVVVGDFPFIRSLKGCARGLDLLELKPSLGAIPPAQWDSALSAAEVAVITGTAILTGSLARFLSKTAQATRIVVGPSTPMMPVLFGCGADFLAGCRVIDPIPVLQAVRRGLSFSQIKKAGVELLCWTQPCN